MEECESGVTLSDSLLRSSSGHDTRMTPFRDIDRRALELLALRSDGSDFAKRRLVAKIRKDFRVGRLHYGAKEPPDHAWKMCEARLMLGDWSNTSWSGWQYRSEWSASWSAHRVKDGVERWKGQRVKQLYVYGEQGIGDEIFFGTALPWLKTKVDRVVLETDPRLMGLFDRAGIATVPVKIEDRERRMGPVQGDAWTLLGDLLVRSGPQPRPYLVARDSEIERFAHYRGATGVSWRGNQGSYRPTDLGHGVSLQYDMGWDEDVERPRDQFGKELDLRNDIEGLLGLLANLGKVVTVSTSVAHFACALGIETHVVLAPRNGPNSNLLPWKWWCEKTPGKSPWYERARVYKDLRDYRSRHESHESGMGKTNRRAYRHSHERPELAEVGGLR